MKKLITASLVSLAFAGTAAADQIYIDVGADYGGNAYAQADGNTTTGWKDSLKLTYTSNSVVTDVDGSGSISVGDTIVSSGGIGFGGTISSNRVTELVDGEGFNFSDPSDNGYGSAASSWVLSFKFNDLMGVYTTNGVGGLDFNYTSGTIDWVLFDVNHGLGTEVHLFSTYVKNHTFGIGNQVFSGDVGNFGGDTVNGVAAGDIFNIAYGNTSMSFQEYATQHVDAIRFRIDQNTDQPTITGFFGDAGCDAQAANQFCISGQHDGSLEFAVPEPTTIAILGLGLLGFAGASRRKS